MDILVPISEEDAQQRIPLYEGFAAAGGPDSELWQRMLDAARQGMRIAKVETAEEKAVKYATYIQSQEWKCKADAAKERAGWRCQVCNSAGPLNAHHRTYERLGREHESDIIVLCRPCHTLFHENGKLAK